MSIRPSLCCPTDFSTLLFRFIDPRRAGIVQGLNTLYALDLTNLNIPITQYKSGAFTLKKNSVMILNVDEIASKGPLKEEYQFYVNLTAFPNAFDDGTTHTYNLYDSENALIESFSFTVDSGDPDYIDFQTALKTEYDLTTDIKNLVTFNFVEADFEDGKFNVKANTAEIKYRHVFIFDEDGSGGVGPYEHPGNLIKPYRKYENGAVKFILLLPEYDKPVALNAGIKYAFTMQTPSCSNTSTLTASNKKYFNYTGLTQYLKINNTETPIVFEQPVSEGNTEFTWLQNSTDHIGYHLNEGDLINTVENPLYRAIITDIDGYTVTVDQPITTDLLTEDQQANHLYSPSTIKWEKAGGFLFLSGATDLNDEDYCFIDPVVLKNPHNFDIQIKYMVGI